MHTAPWLSPLWNSVSEDREGDGAGPTPTREGDGGRAFLTVKSTYYVLLRH